MPGIESCAYSHLQCWRTALHLFVVDEGVPGEKAAETWSGPFLAASLQTCPRYAVSDAWSIDRFKGGL